MRKILFRNVVFAIRTARRIFRNLPLAVRTRNGRSVVVIRVIFPRALVVVLPIFSIEDTARHGGLLLSTSDLDIVSRAGAVVVTIDT